MRPSEVLNLMAAVFAFGAVGSSCYEAHLAAQRDLPSEATLAPPPPPAPRPPKRPNEENYCGCLVCCGGRDTCHYDSDVPYGICAAIEQGGCEYVPIFREAR